MKQETLLDIAKIIVPVIPAIAGYYIAKYNLKSPRKIEVYKEQLNRVYLPLFKALEPNLYKVISKETALMYSKKIDEITFNNYEFVDCQLLYWSNKFKDKLNTDGNYSYEFEQICSIVDNNFERVRKSLKLPTRTLSFKIKNHQLPNHKMATINMFLSVSKQTLSEAFVPIMMGALAYLIAFLFISIKRLFQ